MSVGDMVENMASPIPTTIRIAKKVPKSGMKDPVSDAALQIAIPEPIIIL